MNYESTPKSHFTPKSPEGDFLQIAHFQELPLQRARGGYNN